MTDLTEQWKKGKLPSGWYWVDYYSVDGAVMLEYIPQHNGFGYDEKNLVQAVLAELPDYIEWQNMVNCACEEHKANTELLEENAQLKELLKEWMQFEIEENPNDFTVMSERMSELANKTKEVLKCH